MRVSLIPASWRSLNKRRRSGDLQQVAWEKDTQLNGPFWSAAETAVLQSQLGRPCYFEEEPHGLKSSLLYWLSTSPYLLLDPCWPNEQANLDLLQRRFSTSLLAGEGRLEIFFECEQLVRLTDGPALKVRVLKKHFGPVRTPRLVFAEDRAPRLDFLIPCHGLWSGDVCELGATSLSVRSLQTTGPQPTGKTGECTLYLANNLKLCFPACINSVRLTRQPRRYYQIDVSFSHASEDIKQKIQAVTQSLITCSESVSGGYNAGFSAAQTHAFRSR